MLRASGHSFAHIADTLDVARGTLIAWSKELDEEVSNLRSIETEALQQRYNVMKQSRVTLLGEQLEIIKTELAKRDLASVPTEKLFDLLGKFAGALKQEETSTVFKGMESRYPIELDKKPVKWQA